MVTRILRDDPGKATMHNRQAVNLKLLWESLKDYDMWPIYLIGLTWMVPMVPQTNYLSLTIRSLGFNVFETNLLIIPSSVLFILQLLFWTWFSEIFNQRLFIGLVSQIWTIPLLVALETLPIKFAGAQWVRYALSSLVVGYPYAHATLGNVMQPGYCQSAKGRVRRSGGHKSKCGNRQNEDGGVFTLQHGCPGEQYHFFTSE